MERLWNGCGTVVERLWNGCGTVVERLWNGCGTVVERLWNGCGTVMEWFQRAPPYLVLELVEQPLHALLLVLVQRQALGVGAQVEIERKP